MRPASPRAPKLSNFALTQEDRDVITSIARELGVTMADVVRLATREYARTIERRRRAA
jgi:hypothetical protein